MSEQIWILLWYSFQKFHCFCHLPFWNDKWFCLHSRFPPAKQQLNFVWRPSDVAPSLHIHYKRFITTTSNSVPVSRIGTLILIILVICISSLTSWWLVPAVPIESPIQSHAHYTPDTACTAFGINLQTYPGRLKRSQFWCRLRFYDASTWVRLHSSLCTTHDNLIDYLFLNAHNQHS